MRRKLLRDGHRLLSALLLTLFLGVAAYGQVLAVPREASVASPAVADLLERGGKFEQERRWGDALTYYEDALRQFPGDVQLKRHFDLTRLHYDLGRRYHDRSFREMVGRLPVNEALDLYNEVLLKVQTHYVETPRWKDLVDWGTSNLEVALSEREFVELNQPKGSADVLTQFRQELRRAMAARPVQNRAEARDAVAAAAALAQQWLRVSGSAVVLEYLCGATNSLDQYSTYLTADQLADVYSQIEGNFVGLGIEIKAMEGTLVIVRVIPGSPAKRTGVLDGDRILAINGRSMKNVSTDQAANMLQGESGTTVDLSVMAPGGKPRELHVQRQRVEVPSVDEVQLLDSAHGVAYLKLTCFQKTTYRDLDTALWKLHRSGMRSLVIDVRGNPGGLLVSAVEVADLFVDRGVIVSTRGRSAQEDFVYSAREAGTWHVPLVVLIDQDSASAAEIFAGAIRDHQRGTIVGKRSYGKGSVQGIFPLNTTNAGLRLTTAKFYSPKRPSVQWRRRGADRAGPRSRQADPGRRPIAAQSGSRPGNRRRASGRAASDGPAVKLGLPHSFYRREQSRASTFG